MQQAHMLMSRFRVTWESVDLPTALTGTTVGDVLRATPGDVRDAAWSVRPKLLGSRRVIRR